MQRIRAFSRKMGTPVDTSCVVAIVFPKLLRQLTSHIQQVHPTSGDLNSFVLPIHKWVPLLLPNEVVPQGKNLTRLTGSDFLIQIEPTAQHLYRWTFSCAAALGMSGGFYLFRTENICTEACTAVLVSMRQQRIENTNQLTANGNHRLHPL